MRDVGEVANRKKCKDEKDITQETKHQKSLLNT